MNNQLLWIIGQSPKTQINISIPFYNTKSHPIIQTWLTLAENKRFIIASNAVNEIDGNKITSKDLKRLEAIYTSQRPDKVICLGKVAHKALQALGISHFEAPHPSGLNRKLNDKIYVDNMLNDMKEYLR